MQYNKLVRDKIPEIIKAKGNQATTHVADPAEFQRALRQKLEEEMAEFLANISIEELADILEILRAIAATNGLSWDEVEQTRLKKIAERGAFAQQIILEETTE